MLGRIDHELPRQDRVGIPPELGQCIAGIIVDDREVSAEACISGVDGQQKRAELDTVSSAVNAPSGAVALQSFASARLRSRLV